MLVLWVTIVLGMKNLVLLLLVIAPRIHYLVKVFGMAFSWIMIILQAKFLLLVRVHPLAFLNILQEDAKICEHIIKDMKSWSLNSTESE